MINLIIVKLVATLLAKSRYFKQGEVFPEMKNNIWGETIWYLEVTNKE